MQILSCSLICNIRQFFVLGKKSNLGSKLFNHAFYAKIITTILFCDAMLKCKGVDTFLMLEFSNWKLCIVAF